MDLEHRRLADEAVSSKSDGAGLDQTTVGSVATEDRVLANDCVVADCEQVSANRHASGEDDDASADLGAQGPEVEQVDRRAGEQHEWVCLDEGFDEPEADMLKAPDAEVVGLPAPDESPLGNDREDGPAEEHRPAEEGGTGVGTGETGSVQNPFEASNNDEGDENRDLDHRQSLHRPIEQVAPGANRCRHLGRW